MKRRHEKPHRRVNPSGDVRWVARFTGPDGKRRSAGQFDLKRDAQAAIDAAYEAAAAPRDGTVTVDGYFQRWLDRHPRSDRTNVSYAQRVRYVLDVELEGRRLRDWPVREVRRRQAVDLLDHMLRVQGRAAGGAQGVLRVLSAMWQDAIDDDHAEENPFLRVTVRKSDPRVQKAPRRIRVWTWAQMHELAAAAALPVERDPDRVPVEFRGAMERRWRLMDEWRAVYAEPMLRVLADVGLRLGELLPLERADVHAGDGGCGEEDCEFEGPHLHIRRTAWKAVVQPGTKTDHGEADAGRAAPLPPVLSGMLAGLPRRIDTRLLFPTVTGRLFTDRNFYRDVWEPGRMTSRVGATPHEFRHSYVSLMRAAGVDPADLAAWTGHSVLTATSRYTHAMGLSAAAAREAVGT